MFRRRKSRQKAKIAKRARWLVPAFAALALVALIPMAAARAATVQGPGSHGQLHDFNIPPRTAVLTFDDGPSPYTAQILDILSREQVKATFFVVGNQALDNEDLLKREADSGNQIGNHTFSHPDLGSESDVMIALQLNLDRLIIAHLTGHETRLFRPPFLGTEDSTGNDQAGHVAGLAGGDGYITVGEDVDTEDWRRPGADQIVHNASQMGDGSGTVPDDRGVIILMHDGGGDRSQTVAALPAVIDYYRSRGFTFETVGGAMGMPAAQVMPAASSRVAYEADLVYGVFNVIAAVSWLLKYVIIALIIAGFGRLGLLIATSLIQFYLKRKPRHAAATPGCSIIVPAYNEEAVITSCLQSLLASDYPEFEVLLVDDGSRDGTVGVASQISDARLRIFQKANSGKSSALNLGVEHARYPVIVAVDADSTFNRDTLRNLLADFGDERVGAVSGNTMVGNRHSLITRLQSLEYVIGFNLDRRMGDLLNCITVVPGAIGAFRKEVLQRAGGFSFETLAEDTDLTLTIREMGYCIIYDHRAVAYTEAPASVRDLLKQRFRWSFGTMQAAWKHRSSFLNPRRGALGMVGFPYLVLYQIVFPLISPFFDLGLVLALLLGRFNLVLVSFLLYTAADVIVSGIAILLDGQKLRQLWLIVPQRFIYRQLMFYVIARAFVTVLKGRLVGWNKLKREGQEPAKA